MSATISDARREANRRNARKSTGPRTEAGKAASRRNALRHGLTAAIVDLEGGAGDDPVGPGPIEDRGAGWPGWLAGQVARAMLQIDRAQAIEARLREEAIFRALDSWDDDRDLMAEELGARLGRDPARVVAMLRRTPHGCDWLVERWGWLARAAQAGADADAAGWTEAQCRLAFELLGVPDEGRVGPAVELAAARGLVASPAATPVELARAMIAELRDQRDRTLDADAIAQAGAEAGLDDLPTPELGRVRRYEAALQRRLRWLLDELRGGALPAPADGPPAAPRPTELIDRPAAPPEPEPPGAPPAPAPDEAADVAKAPPGETNPTPPATVAHPGHESRRPRPDLARLARRDRKNRRHRPSA